MITAHDTHFHIYFII